MATSVALLVSGNMHFGRSSISIWGGFLKAVSHDCANGRVDVAMEQSFEFEAQEITSAEYDSVNPRATDGEYTGE